MLLQPCKMIIWDLRGRTEQTIKVKSMSNDITVVLKSYLRDEFNFWNVHGIMNTQGLLQSKASR